MLSSEPIFPKPVEGRIPNFIGAEEAARKLSLQREWKEAEVIFVNPDSPQRHVRYLGISQGKILVMATPRIKEGFLLLDPEEIPASRYYEASTISGAFRYGRKVGLEVPRIDLKVTGSVAVDEGGGGSVRDTVTPTWSTGYWGRSGLSESAPRSPPLFTIFRSWRRSLWRNMTCP
ncbi:MAG: 5-formyltetrahydrofolate cyclo-ligase [Candidatus Korarchaeum sp.]